jgi:hypothetical protein
MDDHVNTYFDGLRLSAQHRFSHNFTLLSVHTYSKCLQSAETLSNKLQGNTESDPYYREADFGLCDFDLRHNFVRLCSAQHKRIYVVLAVMLCSGLVANGHAALSPAYTT